MKLIALLRRWFRVDFAVGVGTLLILASIWTTFALASYQTHDNEIRRGFEAAQTAANMLALKLDYRLAQFGAVHYLARSYGRARVAGSADQDALLIELKQMMAEGAPDVLSCYEVSPEGEILWSTLPGTPAAGGVADRSYLKAIAAGADYAVSEPTYGRKTNQLTFQSARAVRDADGKLIAITVVGIDAGIIKRTAADIVRGEHDKIALVRKDGMVLARNVDSLPVMTVGPVLRSTPAAGPMEFRNRRSSDGLVRLHATQQIFGSDMMVDVGLEQQAVLGPSAAATLMTMRWLYVLTLALVGNALAIICGCRFWRRLLEERKRTDDIARRESLLRQIAENATDMIGLLDAKLELIYVNPAYQALLDHARDGRVGGRFGATIARQDIERVEVELAAVVKGGGSRRMTYRVQDAQHTVRWLETELVAIAAPENNPGACCFMAMSRDVTARRHDEDALREAQAHVQAMLCHGGGLLCRLNEVDGTMSRSAILQPSSVDFVLGWSSYDLLQPGFFLSQINPDDTPAILAAVQRCRETGEAVVEYRFTNAAGEQRWLRDQMMLGDQHETGCDIVLYVTDITDEYMGRVLSQQSERLATLGLLTTNIAHEMNQPLAAIRMAAENGLRILQRDMNQRGYDEAGPVVTGFLMERSVEGKLQRIIGQTQRVSDVISHVRAFGRSGGSQPESVDIAEVIEEALMLAEVRLVETAVAPQVNLQPGLPALHTVRVPLEQVVLNIIINACDAYDGKPSEGKANGALTEPRPLLITTRFEGESMLVSIADKAGGIPAQVISRVFDPFFTTKPVGIGTGVGLFVSMISINELGGTLTVHNEAGGAVFEIRLPLVTQVRTRKLTAMRQNYDV